MARKRIHQKRPAAKKKRVSKKKKVAKKATRRTRTQETRDASPEPTDDSIRANQSLRRMMNQLLRPTPVVGRTITTTGPTDSMFEVVISPEPDEDYTPEPEYPPMSDHAADTLRASQPETYELCLAVATEAHQDQTRWDGSPYINHPIAVADAITNRLSEQPGFDVNQPGPIHIVRSIAVLHDVMEDNPDFTHITLAAVGVPQIVIRGANALNSKMVRPDGTRVFPSYLEYILSVSRDQIPTLVKIEDIKHNLSDLDERRHKTLSDKYKLALYILEQSRWNSS